MSASDRKLTGVTVLFRVRGELSLWYFMKGYFKVINVHKANFASVNE